MSTFSKCATQLVFETMSSGIILFDVGVRDNLRKMNVKVSYGPRWRRPLYRLQEERSRRIEVYRI